MNSPKEVIFIFIFFFIFSCSQDLDFNQIDDYSTSPSYTVSVTYFSVTPSKFVAPTGTFQVSQIEESSDFRVFETTYFRENLVRLDFNVEVNNEIDRNFIIEFELLDDNNNLIYKLKNLNIEANKLNILPQEIIDVSTNQNIINATRVKILVRLEDPSIPLNSADNRLFEFKSYATLYLETKL